eukprot:448930-Prorocentrum_minimum.AAC.1
MSTCGGLHTRHTCVTPASHLCHTRVTLVSHPRVSTDMSLSSTIKNVCRKLPSSIQTSIRERFPITSSTSSGPCQACAGLLRVAFRWVCNRDGNAVGEFPSSCPQPRVASLTHMLARTKNRNTAKPLRLRTCTWLPNLVGAGPLRSEGGGPRRPRARCRRLNRPLANDNKGQSTRRGN